MLAHIRRRLRNGLLTERALARRLGISQSHINNVLRGRRNLTPDVADLILKYLNYSILDLYEESELLRRLSKPTPDKGPEFEICRHPIGPGHAWSTVAADHFRYRAPCATAPKPGSMILCRLNSDLRMAGALCGADIALLDLWPAARLSADPASLFVVELAGCALLRWIRATDRVLYIADERTLNHPIRWEAMRADIRERLNIVKARVVWLGMESALERV